MAGKRSLISELVELWESGEHSMKSMCVLEEQRGGQSKADKCNIGLVRRLKAQQSDDGGEIPYLSHNLNSSYDKQRASPSPR